MNKKRSSRKAGKYIWGYECYRCASFYNSRSFKIYYYNTICSLYMALLHSIFGNNNERKEKVYKRQRGIMYTIHFICSLVLYLNSLDVKIIMYYFIQLVFLIFVGKSYSYIYKGMSKTVLNNMLMLMTTGFIMLERLGHGYVTRQMAFAAAICFAGLFIPYIIDKFTYFDKLGWIYAVVGIVLLALVFVIGQEKYGAKNWIIIGQFCFTAFRVCKNNICIFCSGTFGKII